MVVAEPSQRRVELQPDDDGAGVSESTMRRRVFYALKAIRKVIDDMEHAHA